ncbi:hypothetical protein T484DRAFT_1766130 [Baffinella frigidus]|nr:hypothetical protein T484DRAFT_1766130 [Cryptophyta sp. CCMP2293]
MVTRWRWLRAASLLVALLVCEIGADLVTFPPEVVIDSPDETNPVFGDNPITLAFRIMDLDGPFASVCGKIGLDVRAVSSQGGSYSGVIGDGASYTADLCKVWP